MFLEKISWEGLDLSKDAIELLSKQPSLRPPIVFSTQKRLALIILYRNRMRHLKKLIPILKTTLPKSTASYEIFVAEQADNNYFNKGSLCNAAIRCLDSSFDYVCFHDVDFLPENIDYQYCSRPLRPFKQTRGRKTYEEEFDEKKLKRLLAFEPDLEKNTNHLASVYPHFWGGVFLLPLKTFKKVNGFGNQFLYWGFEDLDFLCRLFAHGETPYTNSKGVFQLQHHLDVLQKGDPNLKKLILSNLDRYRIYSKYFKFPDGFLTLEFDLFQIKKEVDFTRLCLGKFRQKN